MSANKIYSKAGWSETQFFNRLKMIVDSVENKITKVETAETFSPEFNINMNGLNISNVEVDESNESSVANIQYVKTKLENINEHRTISVFENVEDATLSEGASIIALRTLLSDNRITGLADDGSVELLSGGLYKIDMTTDLEGAYDDGYLELIVSTTNVDGIVQETVVKKHHLGESLLNSFTKSFDGSEILKLRVTNTSASKTFRIRTTLVIDKIY